MITAYRCVRCRMTYGHVRKCSCGGTMLDTVIVRRSELNGARDVYELKCLVRYGGMTRVERHHFGNPEDAVAACNKLRAANPAALQLHCEELFMYQGSILEVYGVYKTEKIA